MKPRWQETLMLSFYRIRHTPFCAVVQYTDDAWSEWSKPLFQLLSPKIRLIYSPHIGNISDIKLIRTDTTLDLSQKAEKRWPINWLLWSLHAMPMTSYLWFFVHLLWIFLWFFCGFFCGFFLDFFVDLLWIFCGFSVDFCWFFVDFCWFFVDFFCGFFLDFLWTFCGFL